MWYAVFVAYAVSLIFFSASAKAKGRKVTNKNYGGLNMGLFSIFRKKARISAEAKAGMDEIVNELLPIYQKLALTGFAMGPPEFQIVYDAGKKAYHQYGFDAMAYGVKKLKELCPASTTSPDVTWSQVINTIKTGSHPSGSSLFKQ